MTNIEALWVDANLLEMRLLPLDRLQDYRAELEDILDRRRGTTLQLRRERRKLAWANAEIARRY